MDSQVTGFELETDHKPFNLLALPEEIVLIILSHLTLADKLNMFDTCQQLSRLLAAGKLVSRCAFAPVHLSAASLRHPLFRKLAHRINDLDLSRVSDLTMSKLLPPIKHMTELTSLDISYTPVSFSVFKNIKDLCPKLKRVSINFDENVPIDCDNLELEYVKIVSDLYSIKQVWTKCSKEVHVELNHCKADWLRRLFEDTNCRSKLFSFHVQGSGHFDLGDLSRGYDMIGISKYLPNNKPAICVSPNVFKAIDGNLTRDVCVHAQGEIHFNGPCSVYLWSEDIVANKESYLDLIYSELECIVPHYFCVKYSVPIFKPNSSNSYFISNCTFVQVTAQSEPKKRRVSRLCKLFLNIDSYVQEKKDIKLTIMKHCTCAYNPVDDPVSLDTNSASLKYVTFLHLYKIKSLDKDFFKTLFGHCLSLNTLNIEVHASAGQHLLLANDVHLAKSLVNLRILENGIDESRLLEGLYMCPALENLHICGPNSYTDASESCIKVFMQRSIALYNLVIHYSIRSESSKKKKSILLKNAIPLNKKNVFYFDLQLYDEYDYLTHLLNDLNAKIFFQYNVFQSFVPRFV